MKKQICNMILVLIFLAGVSIFLYPAVSSQWNDYQQSRLMTHYTEAVSGLGEADFSSLFEAADAYNKRLPRGRFYFVDGEREEYDALLNVSGDGIMGGLMIPKIKVSLPIGHGTSEETLQAAVGHLEGSSLPVGGASTHCVLSGHRGLPSAKLFTNLDQLEAGDCFYLRILDQVLTYQVEEVLTVLPEEISPLLVKEGQDLCTLVTCTPYGINTHRLLVRGHRIETVPDDVIEAVNGQAARDTSWIVPAVIVLLLFAAVVILLFAGNSRKRKRRER